MTTVVVVALLLAAPDAPIASPAQFVARVREATARYQDRAVAVADGYRLVGDDSPEMGEHWVNIGLVFGESHDPARPEFLTYVSVEGRPRLTGVAYAVALLPGESPPDWPWGAAVWHEHVQTVEAESLIPHGAGAHHHEGAGQSAEPRLAMTHAWVWLANPEGDFAADNWALPYFRLGLATPDAPVSCAKALSLVSGGDEHLAAMIENAGARAPAHRRAIAEALAHARLSVRAIVAAHSGPRLEAPELAALAESWARLWSDLDRRLPQDVRHRLAAVR
jgi:hypothetical protein